MVLGCRTCDQRALGSTSAISQSRNKKGQVITHVPCDTSAA